MSGHTVQKQHEMQEPPLIGPPMTSLLTTRDVQDLINVDKSTIYRMAEDGRLPAVKVGRQWRFPASAVASLLGEGTPALAQPSSLSSAPDLGDLLDPEAAQAVADLVADLFGVMAVVADMEGAPLTTVANPCSYFEAIQSQPGAIELCAEGWRLLGKEPDLDPRFMPTHLGFMCARTFIRLGNSLAGMLIVGGVTPPEGNIDRATLERVAVESGVDVALLTARSHATYDLDPGHQAQVLKMLPRISDLISRLMSAQSRLIRKIDAVAGIAGAVTNS